MPKLKERTEPRLIRFKITTIKKINQMEATEGSLFPSFGSKVRVLVEKQLKKERLTHGKK